MYDLSELEAFVTVVRAGSLTAGSRELGQPKSTLSRKLRHLEVAVGQPLLSRHSRRIEPNEAGRVFYGYSMSILELVEEGREALDGLRDTVRGTLRLSSHEAFVRGWFAGTVRGFLEQHPELRVTVSTRAEPPSDAAEDLCLWLGDPGASSQRQEPLGCLSQGVYASPDYLRRHGSPQAPAGLSAHHWVDLVGWNDQSLELQHPQLGRCPVAHAGSGLTVDQFCVQADAIAAGRGLGLMPNWLAERRLQAHPDQLVRCLPEWQGPPLPVTAIYSHGQLPRRVRVFLAYMRAHVPEGWR